MLLREWSAIDCLKTAKRGCHTLSIDGIKRSTPRRQRRRYGRASTLARAAAAGRLRGKEMSGQLFTKADRTYDRTALV